MTVRTSFRRDAVASVSINLGGRLINLAGLAVITRQYSDSAYGVWTLLLATASFFSPLATLRYDTAILLGDRNESAYLGRRILLFAMMVCTGIFLLVKFGPGSWAQYLSGLDKSATTITLALPAVAYLLVGQLVGQMLLTRERRFILAGVSIVTQTTVTMLLTIALPRRLGYTANVAVASGAIGLVASILVLLPSATRLLRNEPNAPRAHKVLQKYAAYPRYALPGAIALVVADRLIQSNLAIEFSVGFAGTYATARGLLLGPASILASSVRNVLAVHGREDTDLRETRIRAMQFLRLGSTLVIPVATFGAIWMQQLTTSSLGARWQALGPSAFAGLFPAVALILTGPLDRMFDLVGKQRRALLIQIGSDVAELSVLVLCLTSGASFQVTVLLLCLTETMANVVWLIVLLRTTNVDRLEIRRFFLLFSGHATFFAAMQIVIRSVAPGRTGLIVGVTVASCGAVLAGGRRFQSRSLLHPAPKV